MRIREDDAGKLFGLGQGRSTLVAALSLVIGLCSCSKVETSKVSSPVGPTRVLAVDALVGSQSIPASLQSAQNIGAHSVTQLITWPMIETSPGVYNTQVLFPSATAVPQQNMSLSLMIAVIDTNVAAMPADLAGLPFDNPVVISRFEVLLDQIFAAFPNTQLFSLGIGNEVDAYLDTAALWTEYGTFYQTVATYARSKRPGLRVGVQGTLYGMLGASKTNMLTLSRASDVYMVSYYPLNADYTVKDPSVVASDVNALTAAYTDKPIEFREAGYPSSSSIGSSDATQSRFVDEMFLAWDAHPSQIEYVCFTRLYDMSAAAATTYANLYHITNPSFLAYLESLGLETFSDAQKPAYSTLQAEAQIRGL